MLADHDEISTTDIGDVRKGQERATQLLAAAAREESEEAEKLMTYDALQLRRRLCHRLSAAVGQGRGCGVGVRCEEE